MLPQISRTLDERTLRTAKIACLISVILMQYSSGLMQLLVYKTIITRGVTMWYMIQGKSTNLEITMNIPEGVKQIT